MSPRKFSCTPLRGTQRDPRKCGFRSNDSAVDKVGGNPIILMFLKLPVHLLTAFSFGVEWPHYCAVSFVVAPANQGRGNFHSITSTESRSGGAFVMLRCASFGRHLRFPRNSLSQGDESSHLRSPRFHEARLLRPVWWRFWCIWCKLPLMIGKARHMLEFDVGELGARYFEPSSGFSWMSTLGYGAVALLATQRPTRA